MAMFADIFLCVVTTKVGGGQWLLASSRQRPGLLLNILGCSGQPLTAKSYRAPNVNSATDEKPYGF